VQADPLSAKGLYLLGISLAGQNKDKPEAGQHLRAYLLLNLPTTRDTARQWLKNVEEDLKRRP